MKKYPPPHIRNEMSRRLMHYHFLVALAPTALAAVYYYGIRALILIVFSMALFSLSDTLVQKKIRKSGLLWEPSGLVSGLLFALMLAPSTTLFTAAVGVLFGSLVIKQAFGGMGSYIFQPALAARFFVAMALPGRADVFEPIFLRRGHLATLIYNTTRAPSEALPAHLLDLFFGRFPSAIGTTCVFAILLGGVYLYAKRMLRLELPLAALTVFSLGYLMFSRWMPSSMHLGEAIVTSGLIFALVFLSGDETVMPTAQIGRVLAGGVTGLLFLLAIGSKMTDQAIFVLLIVQMMTLFWNGTFRKRMQYFSASRRQNKEEAR